MNEVSTGVVSFTSNLEIDFDWQVTQYRVTAAPNTRVFDFTMTPASSRNVILVNGTPIEGYHGEVPWPWGRTRLP